MKKAVIIGAGQTGRGFIAPIVQENGYAITFLDKDHALVEQLRKEKEYTVSYFGGKREPQHISGYSALTTDEKEAVNALVEADVVFVSVFASHVGSSQSSSVKQLPNEQRSLRYFAVRTVSM